MPGRCLLPLAIALAAVLLPDPAAAQKAGSPVNVSTAKGILVPRLTAVKRRALPLPAAGTLVFQTDSTAGFYYFNGTVWLNLASQNVLPKPAPKRKTLAPPNSQSAFPTRALTLAGRLHPGHADGAPATFSSPYGVAVDRAGTVYVADTYNHRIRSISPAGVVSTLAGGTKGYAEGLGPAARFNAPTGVAVDGAGTVYVADAGNNRIRRITPRGEVSTLAGEKQGHADGTGLTAAFHNPYSVALDQDGRVYVADASNNRICKITPDGAVVTLAGGLGTFDRPTGIALDLAGTVYVADANHNSIRKISPDGTVSTLAGGLPGFADGPGPDARFSLPSSLAVDETGTVYVSEQGNNRVRVITPAGEVSTLAGSGIATYADGRGERAAFNLPTGIAVDGSGALYIADMGNNSIRKLVFQ